MEVESPPPWSDLWFAADDNDGRCSEVFALRLGAFRVVTEIGVGHIGCHRGSESQAAIAGKRGETPGPCAFVARRPRRKFAELDDGVAVDGAFGLHG